MARIIFQTLDEKMGFSNVITVVSWFPYEKQLKKTLEKKCDGPSNPREVTFSGIISR